MSLIKQSALSIAIMLCSGCVTDSIIKDNPDQTLLKIPESWQAESAIIKLDQPQNWLDDLHDPLLNQLVAEAIQNNLTLKASHARWQAAQAQSTIAGAPLKPSVAAGTDVSRQRANQISRNNYSLDVNASWEVDVWGRLSNAAQTAIENEHAFAADVNAAQLSLAANVALNWFAITESSQQESLAQQNADTFKQSLEVIEERYRRGLNTALDVRLARSEVASAENQITSRRQTKDGLLRQLDVQLGRYPAAEIQSTNQLPTLIEAIPVGLPAQLLSRRPDLIAAEHRLNSAGERLEQARKNRLPTIRLTANGGLSSPELNQLLDWDSLVWTLLAGITQPIFEGGRLDAERALAKAQHSEAWASYAQTTLQAFREVETALAAEDQFSQQLEQLQRASNEAQQAAELALSHYQRGLADIITLLQSQRRAFDASSRLLRTSRERLDNRVALYLALGGEFLSTQSDSTTIEKD